MSQFEENLTHFDLTNKFQIELKDQMRLTMDKMVADSFKETPIKYVGNAATSGTFSTNGTPATAATSNLSVAHLAEVFDYMHGDLKCPKTKGGKYIGILSTKAARGLKSDDTYRDWLKQYAGSPGVKTFMSGMIAHDIEGFMLYETNHFDALDNTIGTGSSTGEAVFFGADAVGMLTVEDPELRRSPVPEDLGRFFEIGWVGTIQSFLTWEKASQARAVHWSST